MLFVEIITIFEAKKHIIENNWQQKLKYNTFSYFC